MSLTYDELSSIQFQVETIIDDLNQVVRNGMEDLIALLWLIHPFREGNTRTVMRFAELFANAKGFPLNSKFLRDQCQLCKKIESFYQRFETLYFWRVSFFVSNGKF